MNELEIRKKALEFALGLKIEREAGLTEDFLTYYANWAYGFILAEDKDGKTDFRLKLTVLKLIKEGEHYIRNRGNQGIELNNIAKEMYNFLSQEKQAA